MSSKEFDIINQEIEVSSEVSKDEYRYLERIEKLVNNQEEQLKEIDVPFEERIRVDNPHIEDINVLENIYSNLEKDDVEESLKELYKTYENKWNKEGIKELFNILPEEKLEKYSAKTSNGNLASLEIQGRDLNNLNPEEKKVVVEKLSVLRNLWYCYYGFYDLKLVASYLEYGKQKGLNTTEALTKFVEDVSTSEDDTYYLVFGGKKIKNKFEPKRVLGHIGMVNGIEYPEDKGDEIYDPQKHILHVDKLHLSEEALKEGKRIVKEINIPVKVRDVREIIRFVKSPFIPAKKQVFVAALLSSSIIKRAIDMQNFSDMLIYADVDKDIAGKTAAQMGYSHSYTGEKFAETFEKQGVLMFRWMRDENKLVKTGPTLPLFFTGRDLIEDQERGEQIYNPVDYLNKVFEIANILGKREKFFTFLNLVKESTFNQLYSSESKYVKVNENGNGNEVHYTGQVGGPEGLINVKDNEKAFEIARKYYGRNPNFLPLPYDKNGIEFSKLNDELLERVLYALEKQKLEPLTYNLDKEAHITPLGNLYIPMLRNLDELEGAEKNLEFENQRKLVGDMLARSKFLPLIKRFLENEREKSGDVSFFEKIKAKYFKDSKLSLNEVRRLTSIESINELQNEVFSNSLFVCAGLGTGGMSLAQDLRKSIPVADYILIDHGVVDSDNGHQNPSLNELGASKLAVAVDGMMKDLPIAPWGSKENLIGGVTGFATPYSKEINDRIEELIEKSGKENIVLVDEIDVTDGKTILQKIEFHKLAIDLAKKSGKPISVTCGLDLGQCGVWRGHFVYDKDTKPFYGLLDFKEGAENRANRISPLVLLAPLLIGSELPTELELLLADMARDGSIEGVGQTVYSSNQSSTHVGNSAVLGSMMQSINYTDKDMRKVIRPTYIENPMKDIFDTQTYERYENYSGRDGFLLLPFLLYLSSQVYNTDNWPKNWSSLADPKIAYNLKTINTVLEG